MATSPEVVLEVYVEAYASKVSGKNYTLKH